MVEENVAEISTVFKRRILLETSQILSEMIAFEEDRRVVIKIKVE